MYVEGLTVKYAFMAFIHQMAFSVSPEESAGRAALISMVLVVDIGFAGGGGGLTDGKGLVTGMLGSELEGGSGAMHLGGEGRETGLTVY